MLGGGRVGYLTFVSVRREWRLHEDLGGSLLAVHGSAPQIHDLSAASKPVLWLSCLGNEGVARSIYRLALPGLSSPEPIPWDGERIGAIACSPDGTRAVVVEVRDSVRAQPRMRVWDGGSWQHVETDAHPDISSKVAWLDDARIAYETHERRLLLLDMETGAHSVGPPGCCPAPATEAAAWYAVVRGRVSAFRVDNAFSAPPAPVERFRFGTVSSLAVTRDGEVCSWTEPRALHRHRAYMQRRDHRRRRFRERERGAGVVIGPYGTG